MKLKIDVPLYDLQKSIDPYGMREMLEATRRQQELIDQALGSRIELQRWVDQASVLRSLELDAFQKSALKVHEQFFLPSQKTLAEMFRQADDLMGSGLREAMKAMSSPWIHADHVKDSILG